MEDFKTLKEAKKYFGKKVKVNRSDTGMYPKEGVIVGVDERLRPIVKGGTWWKMDDDVRVNNTIDNELVSNGDHCCIVRCGDLELIEEDKISDDAKLEITIAFKLRLNVDSWGEYKKGDIDTFNIKVFDENTGLVRFPISKRWDVISYEIVE